MPSAVVNQMRSLKSMLPHFSLGRLLFYTYLAPLAVAVGVANWKHRDRDWYWLPDRILGNQLDDLLSVLLPVSGVALLFIFVTIWRRSPRQITVVLFLVVTAIAFPIFFLTEYFSDKIRRQQAVVGLMLMLSTAALVEVRIFGLSTQHLRTAIAAILVAFTYWFFIVAVLRSV